MKVSLRMAVVSVPMLALAACAGSEGMTRSTPASEQYAETVADRDAEYIARVEATARRRGIDLTWVNPPRKSVAKRK